MEQQKTVLITGASSGIGKATAELFAEKGWNVIATMRDQGVAAELKALKNVLVTRLDVTDEASIQAAVSAGVERFGTIHALVNNAGYGAYGPLEATPMEKIRRQFDTNVIGLLAVTKAMVPIFRRDGAGVIVNISSIGGRLTFPLGTLYHGTKFAVEGISESLSYEMAAIGVRVKIVEPGAIKTDFMTRGLDISNNENLLEYQPVVRNLMDMTVPMMENGADPVVVAEVIFEAMTDGTDQLRYTAGEDAKMLMAKRRAEDDATFLGGMREQFGL